MTPTPIREDGPMKYPNTLSVTDVLNSVAHNAAGINGRWVPARSLGFQAFPSRVRAAWLVFTGRADALIWPEGQ